MFGGTHPKLETQGRKLEVFERHIDKHCCLSVWMVHENGFLFSPVSYCRGKAIQLHLPYI